LRTVQEDCQKDVPGHQKTSTLKYFEEACKLSALDCLPRIRRNHHSYFSFSTLPSVMPLPQTVSLVHQIMMKANVFQNKSEVSAPHEKSAAFCTTTGGPQETSPPRSRILSVVCMPSMEICSKYIQRLIWQDALDLPLQVSRS
jgi:hypothetical protein